jgi:RNA-binding protein
MSPAAVKAAPPVLDGRQRRHLRALGHHQKPIVQIGSQGLTPGVLHAVDDALERHELVKVRVASEAPAPVAEIGSEIAAGTRSALAQTIGRTLLFYRPHPKKPRIVLPRGAAAPSKATAQGKATSAAEDEDEDEDEEDEA